MKTIFKNMKGEWDNFNVPNECEAHKEGVKFTRKISFLERGKGFSCDKVQIFTWNDAGYDCSLCDRVTVGIADLLANKSWTDACGLNEKSAGIAFSILRNVNEAICIDFIKRTMV